MTGSPIQPAAATVSTVNEPTWVRHGSAKVQQDYRAAAAFETALLEQLTRSMTQAAGMGEGGEESEEGSSGGQVPGPISSMLPQALASGIAQGGGLGLAAEITRAQAGLLGEHTAAANQPAATAVGGTQGPGTGLAAGGTAPGDGGAAA